MLCVCFGKSVNKKCKLKNELKTGSYNFGSVLVASGWKVGRHHPTRLGISGTKLCVLIVRLFN